MGLHFQFRNAVNVKPTPIPADEVCDWIISELKFIGKEECSKTLERYWRGRSVEDLVQILKYAEFPEQLQEN